jgi:hypothetical protein
MLKQRNSLVVRTVLTCAGLVGGLAVSPYAAAVAMVILALCWQAYEVLALGLVLDMFWLPPGHIPLFTMGAVALLWLFEPLRKRLFR